MTKRSPLVLLAIALAFGLGVVCGQEKEKPKPMEFETYSLVLLRSGANQDKATRAELMEIQRKHLGHLSAQADAGKMVIAGPFDKQEDKTLRGLCLYRTPLAEAKALASADPAVKAGRLKVEVLTWYVQKGHIVFPKAKKAKKPQDKPTPR
jgi:uncharacterized protein YciI